MTISAERTKQLDIFCRITGFASEFLDVIDVELIRFFRGALDSTDLSLTLVPLMSSWYLPDVRLTSVRLAASNWRVTRHDTQGEEHPVRHHAAGYLQEPRVRYIRHLRRGKG